MMTATMDKRANYPYVPSKAWWDLRKRFIQSIPGNVTTDYLQSVLSVEKSAATSILGALKTLGAVDESGKPTQLAYDWRSDEHYADACREMVERVYPPELLDAFPDTDVDREPVERWFMRNTGTGQNAAYKR
ncbi:MAG TPA: DUF5343 domain-containing protein, partial [Chloroflexota bacterium]|nr:DUF5343 domain-containing protein [Chloroflexota bacterium]